MTDPALGHIVRMLRIHHRWRQRDLARRAHVSVSTVARIERGLIGGVALDRLRRVFAALGGRVDLAPKWNGGELDRLLRARHSALHEVVATRFVDLSEWVIAPEVSFSIYGERGVIDILAWHAATRTLLVIELKAEIVDVNELMAKADQRRRLAVQVAAERGWMPLVVGVWIVVADSRTNRRRLAAHRTVLRAAFPTDGRSVEGWLRKPSGPIAALSFLTNNQPMRTRTSLVAPKRVRIQRARTTTAAGS